MRLVEKYRNNALSRQEYDELLGLIGEQDALEVLDCIAEEDWKESKNILLRTEGRKQPSPGKPLPVRGFLWGTAASFALLITAFFFWSQNRGTEAVVYQTGFGETRAILLPDSSSVLLNANSRLAWNEGWRKTGKRTLTLEGEAFFNVKKVDGMEFIVKSDHLNVKVLGTVFNFRSRSGQARVFLESGRVNLEIPDLQRRSLVMTPGNAVSYDSGKKDLSLEESSLKRSASWVEGMLVFENTSLGEILLHMQDLYGKKFKPADESILEKRMDLSLPYSNWDLIKKALELSLNVRFSEKQDTIVVN